MCSFLLSVCSCDPAAENFCDFPQFRNMSKQHSTKEINRADFCFSFLFPTLNTSDFIASRYKYGTIICKYVQSVVITMPQRLSLVYMVLGQELSVFV